MKNTALLPTLFILLAAASRAAAQAEPAPAPTPEATPTPMATPADIPIPLTPSPSPSPAASPAQVAASEKPAGACPMCGMAMADCKDEPAAKTAAGDARPAEPAAKPAESDEAVFTKVEQDWGDAMVRHDADALEHLEADDYTYTGPDGGVSRKADDLAIAKAGVIKIDSFTHQDLKVHVYGETAVVTGETVLQGSAGDRDLGGRFRWTDVFVKRDNRWQVVASQATTVGKPPEED